MSNTKALADALQAAGHHIFREESSYPDSQAERNLMGRTHYVDPDTRRHFKSRILAARIHADGLIFSIIESCSADYKHSRRIFRPVVFDIFGTVIHRPDVDASMGSTEYARKAFYAWYETFDVAAHYRDVLERRAARLESEAAALRAIVGA